MSKPNPSPFFSAIIPPAPLYYPIYQDIFQRLLKAPLDPGQTRLHFQRHLLLSPISHFPFIDSHPNPPRTTYSLLRQPVPAPPNQRLSLQIHGLPPIPPRPLCVLHGNTPKTSHRSVSSTLQDSTPISTDRVTHPRRPQPSTYSPETFGAARCIRWTTFTKRRHNHTGIQSLPIRAMIGSSCTTDEKA
jgi:hypothetical protein